MKDMIQQIVEADRKAQALVQQAEKEKQNAEGEILLKRRSLAKEAKEKADEKIRKSTEVLQKRAEKKWEESKKSYDGVAQKLEQDYQNNKEKWVSEIVSRVLGK